LFEVHRVLFFGVVYRGLGQRVAFFVIVFLDQPGDGDDLPRPRATLKMVTPCALRPVMRTVSTGVRISWPLSETSMI
jgi:hypothetical protein